MASAIQSELLEATDLTVKKKEDRQTFLHRLLDAVQDLDDDAWKGLSTESQSWVNDNALKIKNHGEDAELDDFPDDEDEEAPEDEDPGEDVAEEETEEEDEDPEESDDAEEATEEEEDPVSVQEEEKTTSKKAPAKKKAAAPAKKAAPAKAKTEKPEKKAAPKEKKPAAGPKSTGIKVQIKKMVFKNPSITVDDLLERLGKGGVKPSKLTVSAIRSEFRHSLFVLRDLEALKGEVKL